MGEIKNSRQMIDRVDPTYVGAVVKKKSQEDPKETSIRNKIRDIVSDSKVANKTFPIIRELQVEYLRDVVENKDNPEYVHDKTQETVEKISDLLNSQIVEGGELLNEMPKGGPALIMTNHFGGYKLFSFNPKEVGVNIPGYEAMYPYLMYFAALNPVAKAINDKLYYVSEDFPLVFGQIHTAAGFIHVPPKSVEVPNGRTKYLQDLVKKRIQRTPSSAFVNFPEGGTSGKYSGLGPYDLDPFKTGGYVVAANLGIHVVPAAQYLDPEKGFQIKVFKPFIPEKTNEAGYKEMAESNRSEIQKWLDQRKD